MNPYCFPEQKPILFVGIAQEQQDWDVEMSAIEDTAVDAIEQYISRERPAAASVTAASEACVGHSDKKQMMFLAFQHTLNTT
ncbi:unnamed protein product [Musa hybrid cultivar]